MVADNPNLPCPPRPLRPNEVRYNVQELREIAKIFQSHLGSSRDSCDESGQRMWDRIDKAIAGQRG